MANEKRLIDVNPYIKTGWHLVRTGKSNEYLSSLSLADVPTVDAVEVVRCKDCKFYELKCFPDGKMRMNCENNKGIWTSTKPDDFCSYGERKDNDQNN